MKQKNIHSSQHLMVPSPKLTIIFVHKTGLNRYKVEIIPCFLSGHHRLRLIFNNINNRKLTYTWKLNNTLLNDNLVKEEIKKLNTFYNLMKMKPQHTQTYGTQ